MAIKSLSDHKTAVAATNESDLVHNRLRETRAQLLDTVARSRELVTLSRELLAEIDKLLQRG